MTQLECKEAREFIQDNFFEELSKENYQILTEHIKNCESCQKYSKQISSVEDITAIYKEQYLLFCEIMNSSQPNDLDKEKIGRSPKHHFASSPIPLIPGAQQISDQPTSVGDAGIPATEDADNIAQNEGVAEHSEQAEEKLAHSVQSEQIISLVKNESIPTKKSIEFPYPLTTPRITNPILEHPYVICNTRAGFLPKEIEVLPPNRAEEATLFCFDKSTPNGIFLKFDPSPCFFKGSLLDSFSFFPIEWFVDLDEFLCECSGNLLLGNLLTNKYRFYKRDLNILRRHLTEPKPIHPKSTIHWIFPLSSFLILIKQNRKLFDQLRIELNILVANIFNALESTNIELRLLPNNTYCPEGVYNFQLYKNYLSENIITEIGSVVKQGGMEFLGFAPLDTKRYLYFRGLYSNLWKNKTLRGKDVILKILGEVSDILIQENSFENTLRLLKEVVRKWSEIKSKGLPRVAGMK